MKRPFPLAVAQLGPIHLADTRESVVRRLLELLREADGRGAKFVVFPELALTTFFPRYWMTDQAEIDRFFETSMPSPATQPLFDEARRRGIGFYLGFAELTPAGERYNTAILVNRAGAIVGRYRKVHLPGHADHKPKAPFQHLEKLYFNVGNEGFKVWNSDGANIGMCICNDRRWPETFRVMGLQSAEVVVLGYNTPSHNIHWPEPPHLRMFHHLLLLQAHAHENALWVGAAAKCGAEDGFHMIAGSAIVAPSGEIAAQSVTEDDELVFFNCDLALGDTFREHVFNFAKHRRPEHYRLIVDRVGAGRPVTDE
ncbi:MAG: N-carbamoyl-D-amino-acid hydrolase [Burkholderiales bacterium]|nr:N-carbamoyl-D-amino-acid hydrolase [Burkholderiales bacterium]